MFLKEDHPEGIQHLDIAPEIGTILPKISTFDSALYTLRCSHCSFLEERFCSFIEVDIDNVKNLEKQLMHSISKSLYKAKCFRGGCSGSIFKHTVISTTHVFIEPLNNTAKTLEIIAKLDDIPKNIVVGNNKYILRGVVGYTGPDEAIGHFIVYCYRHNNRWEEYDDRNIKSKPCSTNLCLRIQILLILLYSL